MTGPGRGPTAPICFTKLETTISIFGPPTHPSQPSIRRGRGLCHMPLSAATGGPSRSGGLPRGPEIRACNLTQPPPIKPHSADSRAAAAAAASSSFPRSHVSLIPQSQPPPSVPSSSSVSAPPAPSESAAGRAARQQRRDTKKT